MAEITIPSLPDAGALDGTEPFETVQLATSVKTTLAEVKAFILGGAGSLVVATGKTLTANSSLTLAGADSKTLTVSNSLTLVATDGSTLNVGTGGTLGTNAYTSTAYLPLAGGTLVGNLIFTDATYDIGASGATRPRNIFASGTGIFGGALTAASLNKLTVTAPATGSTLTIADGKTLTVSNTLTLTGTDASSVAFGAGGTVVYVANNLSVFAATTSAQLAGVISDETGSGALVFAASPTLTGTLTAAIANFSGLLSGNAGITVGSGQALKLGNAATTGLVAGALAALTNATIVITDSAGQAYRVPCVI